MIGSIRREGTRTIVRNFSGEIVATYNSESDTTIDWRGNKTLKGNQAIRLLS